MRLYPESKFTVEVEGEVDLTLPYFKEKLVGKQRFRIESFFGMKEVFYNGKFEDNKIYFTRSIDSWNRIPIYPTSKIKFVSDPNKTVLDIRCSLSVPWIIFIYLIYLLLILVFFMGWFNATSIRDKTVLIFKILGAVTVLNILLFSYHFSELKNVKNIINEIAKKYSVKSGDENF
ncbi:hypothetical protein [Fluviicola taffensis]|uniref:hypothetical protein n=1 Tax=Fluviicola taffensis TaxID=191579 RepID=UPI00313830ED